MLSGQPVMDPDGDLIPGIAAISVELMEQQGDWAHSLFGDPLVDAQVGLFDVVFSLDRAGVASLRVQGQVRFFVVGRDSLHEGVERTYWQMIGQEDLTSETKGSVMTPWGSIKASFR